MEETTKTLEQIESLIKSFGIIGAIAVLLISLLLFFAIKYWTKELEKSVESKYEKLSQQFKTELDKEFQEFTIRFSSKHQNQTKAIEEVYTQFTTLTSYLDFLNKGDKYEEQIDPFEDCKVLINHRREFIQIFERRKIYLPESINDKIYNLLPVLDNFIDTYKSGHFSADSAIELSSADTDAKFIVAGIWNQKKFDKALFEFANVQKELENLFRSSGDT